MALFNAAEAATYEIKHLLFLEKLPLRESDNLLCDLGVTRPLGRPSCIRQMAIHFVFPSGTATVPALCITCFFADSEKACCCLQFLARNNALH